MRTQSRVRILERSGLPSVCIPENAIWDFVEYMETHQNEVLYGYYYSTDGFTVCFHRMDEFSVQNLLDAWMATRQPRVDDEELTFAGVRELLHAAGV